MKKSRFTDSQIIEAIKRVDAGLPVSELCRELSISTALFLPLACQVRRHGCVPDGSYERAPA